MDEHQRAFISNYIPIKEKIIKSSFGLKNISVLYFIENYTPVKF